MNSQTCYDCDVIRPTVLIADDDRPLADSLGVLAEDAGFTAFVTYDGLEALELARARRPRVLVTDLHMPGMSGDRLVAELRRVPALERIPVMVLTSDSARPTLVRLLRQGADEFVIKPVDPEEFQIRLGLLLQAAEDSTTLAVLASQRSQARRKLEENVLAMERLTVGLVDALESAGALQDPNAGNHIRRVAILCERLALARGFQPTFAAQVSRYAGLHDVGKVGLDDDLKRSTAIFSNAQREAMQVHADLGSRLLKAADMPEIASNIALFHHERADGSGYPLGLGGDLIPPEARIVAIADTWDALTSERPWRTPSSFSFDEARRILEGEAREGFDPALLACFFELEGEARRLKAELTDGRFEPGQSGRAWFDQETDPSLLP
jgi:putative two-component system response regulator